MDVTSNICYKLEVGVLFIRIQVTILFIHQMKIYYVPVKQFVVAKLSMKILTFRIRTDILKHPVAARI